MKLLILGGTRFVGRHITEAALKRGHEVTLFNRGRSNPDLFPEAERLIGDRDGNLETLEGRAWDAVIDVNAYVPRHVRDAADALSSAVGRYIFISTLAVYVDVDRAHKDETARLRTIEDLSTEEVTGRTYGPLKVLCEQAAEAAFPGRTAVVRPGYVVGPWDHTDRLTYWLRRVRQGGSMLAPGDPATPVQFVDGRDLGEFVLRLAEDELAGIFNVTGPADPLTWGELFRAAEDLYDVPVTFVWVAESFLDEHKVGDEELPMWPRTGYHGVVQFDIRKAIAAGLRHRPLRTTIGDTLEWYDRHGEAKAGLTVEREAQLLRDWEAVRKQERQTD